MLYLQSSVSGSFLQTCINFVKQRLTFSQFEGSIIPITFPIDQCWMKHPTKMFKPKVLEAYCIVLEKPIINPLMPGGNKKVTYT